MEQRILVIRSTGSEQVSHQERVNKEFTALGLGWIIPPGAATTMGFVGDGIVEDVEARLPVTTIITTIVAQKDQ